MCWQIKAVASKLIDEKLAGTGHSAVPDGRRDRFTMLPPAWPSLMAAASGSLPDTERARRDAAACDPRVDISQRVSHRRPQRTEAQCAPFLRRLVMGEAGVGWVTAIIVGGIAGWLAEQFMKSNMGLIMNIVLGIVGAAIASAILSALGISLGGWVGYLVSGFIGAVLLIWIVRVIRPA